MNGFFKALAGLAMAAALAACGGGGGSAGSTPGGGDGGGGGGDGGTPAGDPTIALSLVDSSGRAVSGNSVPPGSTVFLRASLHDGDGAVVPNKLVTFASQGGVIAFQPASGQVLTDNSGIATVQVLPADLTSTGADTLTGSATVDDVALSASMDVQTSAANVALNGMTASVTTLTAYQNTSVSVNATVGGRPATNIPVTVGFSSSCGSFSPASAITDSTGKASSTFQAAGCTGGTATLIASAPSASPVQTTVTVQAPQPTNLKFVSATPATIFTASASSGDKQSTVVFQLVDAAGNPIAGATNVRVSLSSAAIAAGVVFDNNSTAPQVVPTDVNGKVQVIVKSGGFPTPLSLKAELVSNPSITASSSGLTVNSGRAVQNFFSLSSEKFNIEGWRYDGVTTQINILAADRLAQPLPDGTTVSFIAEGGQVSASCALAINGDGKSGCSVSLASQDFRPANGRVTVLAYMDGDEIFVDENGDNRYQAGETFYDMGQPFLDANEDGSRNTGEQRVGNAATPGSGIGSSACTAQPGGGLNTFLVANVANTCDGAWGPTRVRAQAFFVFSDSFAVTEDDAPGTVFLNPTSTKVDVVLRDVNGNPLPADTTLSATVSGGTACSVSRLIPAKVPSTTAPTMHRVVLQTGTGGTCSGAVVNVEATTPKGNTTLLGAVTIP